MASHKFLEEAGRHVKPVYAQGFFYVSLGYISYYLIFDYTDPYEYYNTIIKNEKMFNDEITKLWANMQQFLDEENVVVNGFKVSPRVIMIDIGFRGNRKKPYIVFAIRFKAPTKTGVNIYENKYASEIIDYDYVAYWIFPPGSKILKVDMGQGDEEWSIVGKNILAIYGYKGKKTGGYEYIEFELSQTTDTANGEND